MLFLFFFFNDTATTEIYTLSLHDALPIWIAGIHAPAGGADPRLVRAMTARLEHRGPDGEGYHSDRESTRLNSSHGYISYAVFCLKKKKNDTPRDAPVLLESDCHDLRPSPS